MKLSRWPSRLLFVIGVIVLVSLLYPSDRYAIADDRSDYATIVRPLMQKYCLECHSTKAKKGSLDLERFASIEDVKKDVHPWEQTIEMLETGEMPPKKKPQPTDAERKQLIAWMRSFLDAEARARTGDPGHVPLRRLSNAEYDTTIRDLTGVDLRPTREFPADGAAGEGFTNAAEALSDISPALLTKYLNAARELSQHVVLLPDGFRFSATKTRRDWTNESTERLRAFYASYRDAGRLPLRPYLLATIRHRDAIASQKLTLAEVAKQEKLSPKYLAILWDTLTDKVPSHPLDTIRERWRIATLKDIDALINEIATHQEALWKAVPVGSYRHGDSSRQMANDLPATAQQTVKFATKPTPGQSEIVLQLATRDLFGGNGNVIWQSPRFEGPGLKPLLLKDYATFGPAYEVNFTTVFADTSKYLAATIEVVNDHTQTVETIAKKHQIDPILLKRFVDITAIDPYTKESTKIGRVVPVVALELLDDKVVNNRPEINGWKRKGIELPSVVTNATDKVENIPGRLPARAIAVHPTPQEFVAVTWKSPIAGTVRIDARIAHAHLACGNGVAWWIEHRHADRALVIGEGAVDLGKEATSSIALKVEKGDLIILAVDAKKNDHVCDLTEIALNIVETDGEKRKWSLADDVVNNIHDGNPHADKLQNKDTWSFVRGPTRPINTGNSPLIPTASILGRWREAAADPARKNDATQLAVEVQKLLTGGRPTKENDPDRLLFDRLVTAESPVLKGVDLAKFAKPRPDAKPFGLAKERFTGENLIADANSVIEVRLPASLFVLRTFVVDGRPEMVGDRITQFTVRTSPDAKWPSIVVGFPTGAGYRRLLAGNEAFRKVFPAFVCYPRVIPDDEVVCLKMYHREDEPLIRLFLDDEQKQRLDRLWLEHRYISQQPIAENNYLPQFIGFVTQDQPKELLAYFESQRPVFKQRADDFEKDLLTAIPKQMDAVQDFAAKAFRRPLQDKEKIELRSLYQKIRDKGADHDEAFRAVVSRILVSPAFLFRIVQAPAGNTPGPVNDWEIATRLSYFLWSSLPDDELRKLAADGKLRDPIVIAQQTQRMLRDDRLRLLAIEFGTQWIHVRGFDELKEKNEKLFPMFDEKLRTAMYEESILFFQDLFQSDRKVTEILNADHTFLNDSLAKHYGIPGIVGPQFRRVDGVQKFGRGGILGFGTVQAKQSGASRTSPVLRGNWVVETLLGEKLPRPPANVPQLPEHESTEQLSVRQQVIKHAQNAECAVCHVRIDPFGFALERYDPIGRRREKDLGGRPIDSQAKLKDGTEFDGIDGLRNYLLTKKRDVFVRLFCRRLLGYALGRAVTLSDQSLIDEMVAELKKNDDRLSAAVLTIVKSPQFRMIRGGSQE